MKHKLMWTLVFLLMSQSALAQEMGLPITGQVEDQKETTIDYTVRLYGMDEQPILTDSGQLTTDEAGRYTIHVARGASFDVFLSAKTLELQFNGEILKPRIELGYVPMSKLSQNAFLFGGLGPEAYFKRGDKINFNDIEGAPLVPQSKAPLVIENNAIGLGLCADGQLLMVDNQQWACKALPVYRAGQGLRLSNNVFEVASEGITSVMLAPNAVTNAHVARDAIGSTQIQSGAILNRHVVSITADKVTGTAAVLSTTADQSFGTTFSIRPGARQVRVGTGGTDVDLEVNGNINTTGLVQRKIAGIKSTFIAAPAFQRNSSEPAPAGVLVERGRLSLVRRGLGGSYTLYKQLDVQPGDFIRTVRCYHKGYASTSSQYTAQLIESSNTDGTHSVLATRAAVISPNTASHVTVNTSSKTVRTDRSYALWLDVWDTSGQLIGCKVDVLTRRL